MPDTQKSRDEKKLVKNKLRDIFGPLRNVNNRRDWLETPNGKISIFITYSKLYRSNIWWYDINPVELQSWLSYKSSFVIFIRGDAEYSFIIPSELILNTVKGLKLGGYGDYKLHLTNDSSGHYFREVPNYKIERYLNNFSMFNDVK